MIFLIADGQGVWIIDAIPSVFSNFFFFTILFYFFLFSPISFIKFGLTEMPSDAWVVSVHHKGGWKLEAEEIGSRFLLASF